MQIKQCQIGIYQNTVLQVVMTTLMGFIGVGIWAYYNERGIDPVAEHLDGDYDRIFPYFVLEVLRGNFDIISDPTFPHFSSSTPEREGGGEREREAPHVPPTGRAPRGFF